MATMHEWQKHDVPHDHLAEVGHVEDGAGAGRVDAVLGLGADPLGVEVLLGQVAGEGRAHRDQERDDPGDPGGLALAPPGGHEELAPQVDRPWRT